MQVTTKLIKSFKPCQDRLDNWLKHYLNWEGSLSEFLDLEHITHEDKAWVYFRLVDNETVIKVATDIAESVLPIFEAQYPNDSRPRDAIAAARSGDKEAAAASATSAAASAASAADADAAVYAARTAACSAYYAAASAAYSAARTADAAYSAARTADAAVYAARTADKSQEAVNIKLMKEAL